MPKYVLSVDQSTQGTKALIFDENGRILSRADLPHRQIVNDDSWVSHNPEEIFANVLETARLAAEKADINPADRKAVAKTEPSLQEKGESPC